MKLHWYNAHCIPPIRAVPLADRWKIFLPSVATRLHIMHNTNARQLPTSSRNSCGVPLLLLATSQASDTEWKRERRKENVPKGPAERMARRLVDRNTSCKSHLYIHNHRRHCSPVRSLERPSVPRDGGLASNVGRECGVCEERLRQLSKARPPSRSWSVVGYDDDRVRSQEFGTATVKGHTSKYCLLAFLPSLYF